MGVAGVGFVLLGGLGGALGAAAVALAWYFLPVEYAFVAGQVVLAALVAPGGVPTAAPVGPVPIVGVEAALWALLAASLWDVAGTPRATVVFGVLSAAAGGGAWVAAASGTATWAVAGALVCAFAVAAYGLHRYELVALGLVEGEGS
ncbi:MAG: hypothetical protein ABEJ28_06230 [Salinigranum sp.]